MIVCGPAWYAPVCGGFSLTNYAFTPGVHGWQFPVDPYNGVYFSAVSAGTSDNIRSTIGRSDKRYWEVTIDSATGAGLFYYIGLVLASTSNASPIGTPAGTVGYRNTDGDVLVGAAVVVTLPTFTVGDTMGLAWDGASGKVWFSKNGTFSGSPAAGTGQAATLAAGVMYAAAGVDETGLSNFSTTGRFLTGSTLSAPPSGFSCWDD